MKNNFSVDYVYVIADKPYGDKEDIRFIADLSVNTVWTRDPTSARVFISESDVERAVASLRSETVNDVFVRSMKVTREIL